MTTAKRRAIDQIRRRERFERNLPDLVHPQEADSSDFDAVLDEEPIEDDLLRLIFTACHPVLSPESRVALTLRLLGGLSTDEIARAFLVPRGYQLLPTVRGDFLLKLGRRAEARAEFERAATLTRNARERTLLLSRAATCSERG